MFESKLSLYCLKYAESVLPESMVFDGGNSKRLLPISFSIYLIRCDDKNILVDSGCDTMPDFVMKRFYSPAFVLRQVGLSADEITNVIITHAHHDHIDAIRHFNNATIHISKAEYDLRKNYIPNNFKVSTFEDEFSISSQIKIIEYGGHSNGSSIVEIKLKDNIHILAGDECYTDANIKNRVCTGTFYNKKKSLEFIEKYSDKKYQVHTCHDSSLKTERII